MTPPKIESYVVEWFVEDAERYERLSRVPLPQDKREGTGPTGGRYKDVVRPAIITVLLEVPLPAVDGVTTLLRQGNVRGSQYLKTCAEHADPATKTRDRALYLERYSAKLEAALRSVARRADRRATELDDEYAPSYVAEVEGLIANADAATCIETNAVRAALDERKTEVAAKLLSGLPDGDW